MVRIPGDCETEPLLSVGAAGLTVVMATLLGGGPALGPVGGKFSIGGLGGLGGSGPSPGPGCRPGDGAGGGCVGRPGGGGWGSGCEWGPSSALIVALLSLSTLRRLP